MNSYYEKMADGTIRCIDSDIPFEIPQGWEWCRLRNVCTVFGRIGFRGYTKNDIVDKGKGAITISPSNMMENGEMNFNCVSFISWFKYDESPEIQIAEKDILVVKTGSSYGKTCIVRGLPEKATINPQIAVLKFNFINPEILCYILNSPLCKEQFEKYVIGTSIPTFSQEKLSSTLIPLPPLNEQNRLVNIIGDLFGKTDVYCSLKERFDILEDRLQPSLKKSILQEAIQGRLVPQIASEGTAEELLAEIAEEKKRLVKEGKLKASALKQESRIFRGDDNRYYEQIGSQVFDITDEIPFELPKSWSWTRMGYIGDWGAGATPLRGEKGYFNGEILWLKTGELNNDYIFDTEEKITDKALKECSLRLNQIGDILIAMYGATIGKLGIVGKELTTNQACCGCTPFIYNLYLFYFLMASKEDFVKRGEGGAQPNISRIKLVNHLIPLPPLAEQKRIVTQIERLFERIK